MDKIQLGSIFWRTMAIGHGLVVIRSLNIYGSDDSSVRSSRGSPRAVDQGMPADMTANMAIHKVLNYSELLQGAQGVAQHTVRPSLGPDHLPNQSLRRSGYDSEARGDHKLGGNQGHLRPHGRGFAPIGGQDTNRAAIPPQPSDDREADRCTAFAEPDEAQSQDKLC
ncbi:uncharacterized protein PG986_004460 [Apiospora aurea]|uniref:Uncharacterized protein n=1 Tax=Apiospora aurea TaxID=335848 RepID=A0ABR1QN11_9PEZI